VSAFYDGLSTINPVVRAIPAAPERRRMHAVTAGKDYIKTICRQAMGLRPVKKPISARMTKITNNAYAMLVAVPATPDNPSTPAIIATTKNVTAQLSIVDLPVQY
jgi:hypothetical protein